MKSVAEVGGDEFVARLHRQALAGADDGIVGGEKAVLVTTMEAKEGR